MNKASLRCFFGDEDTREFLRMFLNGGFYCRC